MTSTPTDKSISVANIYNYMVVHCNTGQKVQEFLLACTVDVHKCMSFLLLSSVNKQIEIYTWVCADM